MWTILKIRVWAALVGATLVLTPAMAGQEHGPASPVGASTWNSNDYSRIRLIQAGVDEEARDLAGLQFDLEEGWHTYWRSPGRFGIPAGFSWEGSENIRGVEVRWPEPSYISSEGYEAYGYRDRLVLPLLIAREDPSARAVLHLAVEYAVCETVCIPATGFVSLTLPPQDEEPAPNPEYEYLVQEALSLVPTTDLDGVGIWVEPTPLVRLRNQSRTLRITAWSETAWHDPRVIVEGPKGIFFGQAKLALDPTSRQLVALVPLIQTPSAEGVLGPGFRVTIIGGSRSVDTPLDIVLPPTAGNAD